MSILFNNNYLMDYRHKVFVAVAENLSFSKAANELFISQPAVTKHIKELERQLGIALFHRKGNRIYLTRAGEITYKFDKQALQLYNELDFALGALKDEHKGTLRIGASSTIAQYVIPKVLAQYHKRYPKIDLSLFNGNSFEIEQKLIDNKIDIALVENTSSRQNLKYLNFLNDEIVVVAAKNSLISKQENLDVKDLQQIPMVLREHGSGTLEVIEKELAQHEISIKNLNVVLHLGSTESIKQFLTDFEGIALVSERAITNELHQNLLKIIPVKGIRFSRYFRIASPAGAELDGPQSFMNFLLGYNF